MEIPSAPQTLSATPRAQPKDLMKVLGSLRLPPKSVQGPILIGKDPLSGEELAF
jgi:hypothetical protein